jgi:hypothetical protein
VEIVQIWPAADGVADGRSADDFVRSAKAVSSKTSVRQLRIYVNPVRSPDTKRFSMSPEACSELLRSCKDSIRHIAISFAPNPSIKGLEAGANQMAPSLLSLELYVTASTRPWALTFLPKCRILESLTLKHLSSGMALFPAASLESSCKFLRDLRITVHGSDSWTQYRVMNSITHLQLDFVIPDLTTTSYSEFYANEGELASNCGSLVGRLAHCVSGNGDFTAICNQIKESTPPHVGLNLEMILTIPCRNRTASRIQKVFLNAIVAAVKIGYVSYAKSIAAFKHAIQEGASLYAESSTGQTYCPAFCWLAAMALSHAPFTQDTELFEFGSYLVSMVEILLESKWDPTTPVHFQDFLVANVDEVVGAFSGGLMTNKFNAFFVAASCPRMLEVLKLLVCGPTMQKLRAEGRESIALVGPEKESLFNSAYRAKDTLEWIASNIDLFVNPSLPAEARAKLIRAELNAVSPNVESNVLMRFFESHGRPSSSDIQTAARLIRAGVDPFICSFSSPRTSSSIFPLASLVIITLL